MLSNYFLHFFLHNSPPISCGMGHFKATPPKKKRISCPTGLGIHNRTHLDLGGVSTSMLVQGVIIFILVHNGTHIYVYIYVHVYTYVYIYISVYI